MSGPGESNGYGSELLRTVYEPVVGELVIRGCGHRSTNQGILKRFARSNVLVAFDLDGTLAPIVSQPQLASLRASTRALLAQGKRHIPAPGGRQDARQRSNSFQNTAIKSQPGRSVIAIVRGIEINREQQDVPGFETQFNGL